MISRGNMEVAGVYDAESEGKQLAAKVTDNCFGSWNGQIGGLIEDFANAYADKDEAVSALTKEFQIADHEYGTAESICVAHGQKDGDIICYNAFDVITMVLCMWLATLMKYRHDCVLECTYILHVLQAPLAA